MCTRGLWAPGKLCEEPQNAAALVVETAAAEWNDGRVQGPNMSSSNLREARLDYQ